MNNIVEETDAGRGLVRRIATVVLPREGENGLFSQSWFPICLSEELHSGAVLSKPFLDGKVVAYRGADGVAHVMSGYCPHMGGDARETQIK